MTQQAWLAIASDACPVELSHAPPFSEEETAVEDRRRPSGAIIKCADQGLTNLTLFLAGDTFSDRAATRTSRPWSRAVLIRPIWSSVRASRESLPPRSL